MESIPVPLAWSLLRHWQLSVQMQPQHGPRLV